MFFGFKVFNYLSDFRFAVRPGLVCMGGREVGGYLGEWEHALALVMACRYLPIQLLASPGERAGTVQLLT